MLALSAIPRGFRVGDHYPGVYLNHTELRIILSLLRGKRRHQISVELGISERSVDYYCYTMMKLMGFVDIDALIDSLRQNEFFAALC